MKLRDFLSQSRKSVTAFAKEIGVARGSLHRYLSGGSIPRPVVMEKIRCTTDGKVTADDFYGPQSEARQ